MVFSSKLTLVRCSFYLRRAKTKTRGLSYHDGSSLDIVLECMWFVRTKGRFGLVGGYHLWSDASETSHATTGSATY
jgi:hypothetical protein